jgi:hypothetical protein
MNWSSAHRTDARFGSWREDHAEFQRLDDALI